MASFPDPESFRPFVEENFASLASFAWSVLGSGLEAEDVAQEAFVLVYRRRGTLDPGRSARPYLFRTAFRLCLSRLRRQKRRAALALLAAPLARSTAPPPSEPLDAWFRSLSRRQRAIAHLHFEQDRDAGEIAAALGIRPATVRVQLARIRARIQATSGVIVTPRRCPDVSG
jgi:RNA polymerase sigma-70 factor (ECF subfamily)